MTDAQNSTAPTVIVAHGSGVTKLAFSKDGRKLYTSGDDCIVRIWDPEGGIGQEPQAVNEATESVGALDTARGCWAAGGDDATVRRYSADTDEMIGNVAQTGGVPVRCIAFNPQGDKLLVGSDELSAKLVDIPDIDKCVMLTGHTKGLRAATWHPSGSLLTTSGQDGKIIVWDATTSPPSIQHEIEGVIEACADPATTEFSYSVAAVWHPSGDFFAVASRTHEIAIISKKDWKKTFTYSTDGHHSDITSLAYSANGLYLASSGKDKQVIVWETKSREPIARQKVQNGTVIDIAWSPITNLLAWTDMDGAVVRWTKPIPDSRPSPAGTAKRSETTTKPKPNKDADKLKALLEDDEGDDTAMDGPLDEDVNSKYDDDDEGWVENDLGDEYTKDKDRFEGGTREMVNVTKAQPPFQPGSTAFRGKKRYLAFNNIGVIEVSNQDLHHVVNVEFHDKSMRRGYHFQDAHKYSLAALGERGIAFACIAQEEQPAVVSYRPYDSWASNSDWQIQLPAGEDPLAISAGGLPYSKLEDKDDLGGNGYVAVATTKGYVRFFSGGGMQRYVWTVGGQVITMAGGAEWTFVIHREGGTSLDGCQNLRYTLITADSFDIVQSGYLPLPRGTTLTWIGISDEGAPAIYDSAGVLGIMDRFRRPTQGRWIPAVDTNLLDRKVGKVESYWPVGLSSKELMCIILKGAEKEPGFPRPMIQEIEVQMPLLRLGEPQGQAEEKFLRESIHVAMLKDSKDSSSVPRLELGLDKILIQLIQQACKTDRLQRALDAARFLNHLPSYDSAAKVAGFYHLIGLEQKIALLRDRKEDGEDDGDINPREGWGRVTEPIARGYGGASNSRANGSNGFDDFGPPPATTRPTLALAKPVGEVAFVRPPPPPALLGAAAATRKPVLVEDSSMEVDSSFNFSDFDSAPPAAKRKRDESVALSDWGSVDDAGPSVKKRSNGTAMVSNGAAVPFAPPAAAPVKTTHNPFAAKPGAKKNGNLLQKGGVTNKSLVKSNSFFEKVDAAEADAAAGKKGKAKGKEASKGKQTTLFGLPAKPPAEKKATTARPAKKGGKANLGDDAPSSKDQPAEEESQSEMAGMVATATGLLDDTQMEETQEETQQDEEREASPDWEIPSDEEADTAPTVETAA